jgi:hypothetical protein
MEVHFWRYATVLVLCFLAVSLLQDLRMKMWYDELFTLHMARQGGAAEIVKATFAGMDASPPLYPILVSPLLQILRQDGLAVRLPSSLGFAAMLLGVLGFCRRRMPAPFAFIAALLAGISCRFFATEGRSYGLVLGFAAGALFLWQRAHEEKGRRFAIAGLALCLMAMAALHYYSIFFIGPLAAGELVRWRTDKKFDVAIVLALLTPLVVIAIHVPLIVAFRRMSPTYWPAATSSWRQIAEFYFQFSLIPLVTLLGGMALSTTFDSRQSPWRRDTVLPGYEWAAITWLALLPIVVVVAASYTTHLFIPRYVASANIGVSIFTACWLRRGFRAQSTGILVVLGLLLVAAAAQSFLFDTSFNPLHMTHLRSNSGLRQGEDLLQELRTLPESAEPIVIGYDENFLELAYYAEPALGRRLVYPLSRSLDLRYKGFDVAYLNLAAMRERTALPIVDLDVFLSANPRFILAVDPAKDYLSGYLRAQGYRVTPMDTKAEPLLYEVGHP